MSVSSRQAKAIQQSPSLTLLAMGPSIHNQKDWEQLFTDVGKMHHLKNLSVDFRAAPKAIRCIMPFQAGQSHSLTDMKIDHYDRTNIWPLLAEWVHPSSLNLLDLSNCEMDQVCCEMLTTAITKSQI